MVTACLIKLISSFNSFIYFDSNPISRKLSDWINFHLPVSCWRLRRKEATSSIVKLLLNPRNPHHRRNLFKTSEVEAEKTYMTAWVRRYCFSVGEMLLRMRQTLKYNKEFQIHTLKKGGQIWNCFKSILVPKRIYLLLYFSFSLILMGLYFKVQSFGLVRFLGWMAHQPSRVI